MHRAAQRSQQHASAAVGDCEPLGWPTSTSMSPSLMPGSISDADAISLSSELRRDGVNAIPCPIPRYAVYAKREARRSVVVVVVVVVVVMVVVVVVVVVVVMVMVVMVEW